MSDYDPQEHDGIRLCMICRSTYVVWPSDTCQACLEQRMIDNDPDPPGPITWPDEEDDDIKPGWGQEDYDPFEEMAYCGRNRVDGFCDMAGTEYCDWQCPLKD